MATAGQPTPLSQSPLFPGLRDFYANAGITAWAGRVPLYPTSNPALANSYASVIIRFLQDAVATGRVDRNEPFYVAEIGSGSGKFGFHLLRRLLELRLALGLEDLRITYVLSDLAPANVSYWCRHPSLQPFVQRGEMVFALFDAEADRSFRLVAAGDDPAGAAGAEITSFVNPLVVVANYVFDSLPQDLFRAGGAGFEEMLATLAPSADGQGVAMTWVNQPATVPHYGDPTLDAVLAEAMAEPGVETVMFPVAALRLIERLAATAGNRLCLLASDLGLGQGMLPDPQLTLKGRSGFFYLPVDLRLVGSLFGRLGPGINRHQPARSLDTNLAIAGFDPDELLETTEAFATAVAAFGSRGLDAIGKLLDFGGPTLEPEVWLAVAALLRFDSHLLDASVETIGEWVQAGALWASVRQEILAALDCFEGEIYWTPGAPDSYFNLGVIRQSLGDAHGAVAAFRRAIEIVGPATETYLNLGLALRFLGRAPEAAAAMGDALAVDPANVTARGWLGQIELERAGTWPAPRHVPPASQTSGR